MEEQRISELRNYRILDTISEEEFDAITKIISYICDAPISLITLIDKNRQWFKSAYGVGELKETARSFSFCTHTILEEHNYMIVGDLSEDERFIDNPFVVNEPQVRFYAGATLITQNGHKLGTVCVLDVKPRTLTDKQLETLKLMSLYTMKLIEVRRKNQELETTKTMLQNLNQSLEQYAYALAHDIKAPLRTMSAFTSLLLRKAKGKLNKHEQDYLMFIVKSAKELAAYTQNLLRFSKSTQLNVEDCKDVDLNELLNKINTLLNKNGTVTFLYDDSLPVIFTSEIGLQQILQNLISNSIRYRNPHLPNPYVGIEFVETPTHYQFKVIDNGKGISSIKKKSIFKLFRRDKMNKDSTGIGLNVVKRIVEKMNGTISLDSEEGGGTTVEFTIKKVIKNE